MAVAFLTAPPPAVARGPLTEADAVDIWLARWLRVRRKDILSRYGCDPRRLYEIWEGTRFPNSRAKALETVRERYPSILERIDLGPHRRIPLRPASPDQLTLFE